MKKEKFAVYVTPSFRLLLMTTLFLIAISFFFDVYQSLDTGVAQRKSRIYKQTEQPLGFWSLVLRDGGIGLFLIFCSLFTIKNKDE